MIGYIDELQVHACVTDICVLVVLILRVLGMCDMCVLHVCVKF